MDIADCKILVVDDIADNVERIKEMLHGLNAVVETASGGAEALQKIESTRPDILLLDLMMPDVSGWDVLRRVRERHTMADMAVIITSAITDHDNITECYHLGANDYVAKPIVPSRLLNTIQIHASKL